MDSAYYGGFDYDAYRDQHGGMKGAQELSIYDRSARSAHVPKVMIIVLLAIVLTPLIWYALRYIPAFDIDRIEFTVTGGFSTVPQEAPAIANAYIGTSLLSAAPGAMQRQLQSLPVVDRAVVRRNLFSSLTVELFVKEPNLFVASVDDAEAVKSVFMVSDGTLVEIPLGDFQRFGNQVFVVEVSPEHAAYLKDYGLDQGMKAAVSLATAMGTDPDGRYRIVGRIRYEESLATGYGHMVMDLPAYHSILHIREPIPESRLHDAVRLIKLEQESTAARNIALVGQVRYDLYAQSLVKRQ